MIRPFVKYLDYWVISKWFESYNLKAIPIESMPDHGYVFEDDNGLQGFVGIYLTNSNVAWAEYLIVKPGLKNPKRNEVLKDIFDAGINYCRVNGLVLLSLSNDDKITTRLIKSGFVSSFKGLELLSLGG